MIKVLFWCPVNFNIIANGSTTWSENVIRALASIPDVEVTVMLRNRAKVDHLKLKNVKFIKPPPNIKFLEENIKLIKKLNSIHSQYNYIVIRTGVLLYKTKLFKEIINSKFIKKCIFFYIFSTNLTSSHFNYLYQRSHKIFTFNNYSANILSKYVKNSNLLKNKPITPYLPIITTIPQIKSKTLGDTIKIVYAGSSKSNYLVDKFNIIFSKVHKILKEKGFTIHVDVFGVKGNNTPKFITYKGSVPHGKLIKVLPTYHFGIALVSEQLRNSPQISSKVLEYCANTIMPLANKYQGNYEFLGPEFSYVDPNDFSVSIAEIISKYIENPDSYNSALKVYHEKCYQYSVKGSNQILADCLDSK